MAPEFDRIFTNHLNDRVDVELSGCPKEHKKSRAMEILNSAVVTSAINVISPEELKEVENKLFDECPEYEEDLRNEIKEKFGEKVLI
jgi:hypothetical protein